MKIEELKAGYADAVKKAEAEKIKAVADGDWDDQREAAYIGINIVAAALAHYEAMQPDENGLRPCFKCGDKAGVYAAENTFTHEDGWHGMCVNSGCNAQGDWASDYDMAVKFWNETRTDPVLEAVEKVLKGES